MSPRRGKINLQAGFRLGIKHEKGRFLKTFPAVSLCYQEFRVLSRRLPPRRNSYLKRKPLAHEAIALDASYGQGFINYKGLPDRQGTGSDEGKNQNGKDKNRSSPENPPPIAGPHSNSPFPFTHKFLSRLSAFPVP
jgi:hypothetical protein